ncbi:UNVERIFIED_ORG: purine-binding chemotaxis protein CheW [Herbaspirillum seropedicae]
MNDASLIECETAPAAVAPVPGAATPPAYAGTADDDLPPPTTGDTELRQFVTFTVGDEVFGVDMAPVQEIIRVPEVVHVPLAPQALLGLANLRGKVLPIVSLSRIFGLPDRPADDASRAVVIDLGQPLGFVVDHVASVVGVDLRQIEDVACIASSVRTELLSGLIKDVGGHPMIMVLDFARLVAAEFAEAATGTRAGQTAMDGGSTEDVQAQGGDELQLVSFMVAGQEYAVAIEDVQEIVQMPQTIVQVPHAEPHVLGIMTLRNRLLPLVSLRHMFGLPPRQQDHSSRIAVVAPAAGDSAGAVGVVIDTVNEVLRVPLNTVEAVPTLLARDQGMADIARICRLDNGKRLVSVIDAVSLLRQPAIETLLEDNEMNQDKQPETRSDDEEQVVVFRFGEEEFGVPIDSVQEIVRVPEQLTHVPRAPTFVEGVINLRGAVLPVIDLRMRLGLPRVERSDRQRIMVFLIDQVCTGFIVDSVAEVLKIERRAIGPAPSLSSQQVRLLSRMANIEKQKRMIQLVEPRYLVEGEELALLAGMGQAA